MPRFISRGSQQVRELLLQTDVQSLEAAVQRLGEATEAFAALRMDRAVQLALTGRKLDEVDDSQSGSPGGEADAAVH